MPEPEERRRWLDPAAVQAATAGMPGRDVIATRLAREIPWLGEDAARVAELALTVIRDAGLVLVPAPVVIWAANALRGVQLIVGQWSVSDRLDPVYAEAGRYLLGLLREDALIAVASTSEDEEEARRVMRALTSQLWDAAARAYAVRDVADLAGPHTLTPEEHEEFRAALRELKEADRRCAPATHGPESRTDG